MRKVVYFAFLLSLVFIGCNKAKAIDSCSYKFIDPVERIERQIVFKSHDNKAIITEMSYQIDGKTIKKQGEDVFSGHQLFIYDASGNISYRVILDASSSEKLAADMANDKCTPLTIGTSMSDKVIYVTGASAYTSISALKTLETEKKPINKCSIANKDDGFTLEFKLYEDSYDVNIYFYNNSLGNDFKSLFYEKRNNQIKTAKHFNIEHEGTNYYFDMDYNLFYDYFNNMANGSCSTLYLAAPLVGANSLTYEILKEKPKTPGGTLTEEASDVYTGIKFDTLLGSLKRALTYIDSKAYNKVLNYQIKVNDTKTIAFKDIDTNTDLCDNTKGKCSDSVNYYVETGIKNVALYCNELYNDYSKLKKSPDISTRMDECIAFDKFYNELVKNDVLNNLGTNCGFITTDLKKVIITIFDIVKIAGPVIAILLGMLDFVKVVVSGDADKEMKSASKRLMFRLIAAVLLFVIPILLAWSMDLIMIGTGYDPDNPYCGVIDWSKE